MKVSINDMCWNRPEDAKYREQVDNYFLLRLFFYSQSACGRLRDLELAAIGVTPERSGASLLLARNKGESTIAEMANAWLRQQNSVSTLNNRMSKQALVKKSRVPGAANTRLLTAFFNIPFSLTQEEVPPTSPSRFDLLKSRVYNKPRYKSYMILCLLSLCSVRTIPSGFLAWPNII